MRRKESEGVFGVRRGRHGAGGRGVRLLPGRRGFHWVGMGPMGEGGRWMGEGGPPGYGVRVRPTWPRAGRKNLRT
jgi:hypothetical protein